MQVSITADQFTFLSKCNKWYFDVRICLLGLLIAFDVSLLSPFNEEIWEYMCMNLCACMCVYVYCGCHVCLSQLSLTSLKEKQAKMQLKYIVSFLTMDMKLLKWK